jgi:hypothetical protein
MMKRQDPGEMDQTRALYQTLMRHAQGIANALDKWLKEHNRK